MRTIYRKELLQYFHSVIGYVFLAIFILICGYFFLVSNLLTRSGDISDYFQKIVQIMIFLMPVLTMRSFSEEKRQKTEVLLYTKAAGTSDIVLGKFFAAMTVFGAGLAVTAAFPVILAAYGSAQPLLTAGCFAGLILLMGAFIAIGIFVSSLTENQIVAAVGTYLIIFIMWYSYGFGATIQNQAVLTLLNRISLMNLYYELVTGILDPGSMAVLLSVSAVFLFLTCAAAESRRQADAVKSRIRRGLGVLLVLLTVISGNIFIHTLTQRFGLKGDLTEGQLFRLSAETKQILRELHEPVVITCFDRENASDSNLTELLERYDRYADALEVRHLDLEANPSLVSTYAGRGISLTENGVLVEAGGNAAAIPWSDMYGFTTYTDAEGRARYSITSFKAEKKLTSAIVQVSGAQEKKVWLTQGHDETITQGLEELIEGSGYETESGVLGMADLAGVATVIAAGPSRDFSADEISRLEDFLAGGGSLIVLRNPKALSLPVLDGYLAEWGLTPDGTVILEPSRQMDSPMNVIPDFAVHMMNVWFSENSSYLVLPVCGSLTLSSPNGRLTSPVLKSTADSYGKPLAQAGTLQRESGDRKGPFILAATSEQLLGGGKEAASEAAPEAVPQEGGGADKAYVFVVDCCDFYQDAWLSNASLGNGQLILQALSYMNDETVSLAIPEKSVSNRQIAVSWSATAAIAVVFLGLVPLALVLTGLVIYIRRRRA